jgi:hypothetical protein
MNILWSFPAVANTWSSSQSTSFTSSNSQRPFAKRMERTSGKLAMWLVRSLRADQRELAKLVDWSTPAPNITRTPAQCSALDSA